MSASPLPKRIEVALERVLERPFTRRASLDLPLLKTSLKRAMEDELKLVPPSRYTLAVPAEQEPRVRESLPIWREQLIDYFLELARQNGWSVVGQPRIEIAFVPDLRGNTVMVSVDEGYLANHGRPVRRRGRSGPLGLLAKALVSLCIMLAGLSLFSLIAAPDLWRAVPLPVSDATLREAPGRAADWWRGAGPWAARAVSDGLQSASRAVQEMMPRRLTGEVVASPGLSVRAGSPSTAGGTRADVFLPRGTVVQWWSFQEVRGEAIAGEDRWVEIGRAGPEWGDWEGARLYVWIGGLEVR